MNVIGDVGIMIAIFLMYAHVGSVSYQNVFSHVAAIGTPALTWIGIWLFVGAVAKSAQLPLHTWLPDAMEGPTPVSALIHAATMVTAGVYLVARAHPIYDNAPVAAEIVAVVGGATGPVRRDRRVRAVRHQARAGVLDDEPDRLHDPGRRRRGVRRRRLPLHDARVLQSAAVHGGRHHHPRAGRRTGHPQDGRARGQVAVCVLDVSRRHRGDRGHLPVRRLLLQRRRARGRADARTIRICSRLRCSPRVSPRSTCSASCS